MTITEFVGTTLIAFGPAAVMFIMTVAPNPLRVIVLMASAFCWLISLLMTSIIWFAVVPLRGYLAFSLVPSIIFQEVMRLAFFKLLKKAETGLQKMAAAEVDSMAEPDQQSVSSPRGEAPPGRKNILDPLVLSYVSGLGFGVMAGAFSMINMLSDMIGPGTIGLKGQSEDFFFLAALQTLCIILLHTFWGIIVFSALNKNMYGQFVAIIFLHLLVSGLTLINQLAYAAPFITTSISYLVLIGCVYWTVFLIRRYGQSDGNAPDNQPLYENSPIQT